MTEHHTTGTPVVDVCPFSKREDGDHAWHFDCDNPYIVCAWCDEMRDALKGRVMREGRRA